MNNIYLQEQIIKRLLSISTHIDKTNWATWSTHKDFKQTVSDSDMVYTLYHTNGKFDPENAVDIRDYKLVIRNLKLSKSYTIDFEEMIDGLNILHKKYPAFRNKLDNNKLDAATCDAFLQCATFGRIVYS